VLLFSTLIFVAMTWVLGNLMIGAPVVHADAASYELAARAIGPWAGVALAWFTAGLVGFTNALPMQVGVARVLFAMGRDRQLPRVLATVHAKYNTPWVAMIAATGVSLVVALLMRNDMDHLASIVNFGALLGFMMLHACVFVHFAVRKKSPRWFEHVVVPILGVAVVLAVLSGMSALAIKVGVIWLVCGLVWGAYLSKQRRTAVALEL